MRSLIDTFSLYNAVQNVNHAFLCIVFICSSESDFLVFFSSSLINLATKSETVNLAKTISSTSNFSVSTKSKNSSHHQRIGKSIRLSSLFLSWIQSQSSFTRACSRSILEIVFM
jgi:hypothetical protein